MWPDGLSRLYSSFFSSSSSSSFFRWREDVLAWRGVAWRGVGVVFCCGVVLLSNLPTSPDCLCVPARWWFVDGCWLCVAGLWWPLCFLKSIRFGFPKCSLCVRARLRECWLLARFVGSGSWWGFWWCAVVGWMVRWALLLLLVRWRGWLLCCCCSFC